MLLQVLRLSISSSWVDASSHLEFTSRRFRRDSTQQLLKLRGCRPSCHAWRYLLVSRWPNQGFRPGKQKRLLQNAAEDWISSETIDNHHVLPRRHERYCPAWWLLIRSVLNYLGTELNKDVYYFQHFSDFLFLPATVLCLQSVSLQEKWWEFFLPSHFCEQRPKCGKY